jgi:hypothetical protein
VRAGPLGQMGSFWADHLTCIGGSDRRMSEYDGTNLAGAVIYRRLHGIRVPSDNAGRPVERHPSTSGEVPGVSDS